VLWTYFGCVPRPSRIVEQLRLYGHYYPAPRAGRLRIRIYLPDEERDAPAVICTELPGNQGQSVANAVEQLAAEVVRAPPQPWRWWSTRTETPG
jgi:hypothetical protein